MSERRKVLARHLQTTLHRQIPLTNAMALVVNDYDGSCLTVAAPLAPNVNVHGTAFAGSLYSVAALAGWGMMFLQLMEAEIDGSIVIAKADIHYGAPVRGELRARCDLRGDDGFRESLRTLVTKRKARFALTVTIGDPAAPSATLHGDYAVRVNEPDAAKLKGQILS